MAIQTPNRPILIKSNVTAAGDKDSDLADQYAKLIHLREIVWKAEADAIKRAKRQSRPH